MTAHIDAPRSKCPACREEDGLMPEPKVTIGTVLSFFEPDDMDPREAGAKPNVTIQFSRGDRLPRVGDRVAVAGSVDAIFGWMASLPATRVIEAAKAWAKLVGQLKGWGGEPYLLGGQARYLYDAVKALEAGDDAPSGVDPGTVITITIERSA